MGDIKEGISITSLLGVEEKIGTVERPISLDDPLPDEVEKKVQEPEKRATRRSTRVAIDSIVSKDEEEKTKRTRKPRVVKKKVEKEEKQETPKEAETPKVETPKEAETPIIVETSKVETPINQETKELKKSPAGMRPSIMNLMNTDTTPSPPIFSPIQYQSLPPIKIKPKNKAEQFGATFLHHTVTPDGQVISPTVETKPQQAPQPTSQVVFAPPVSEPPLKPKVSRKRKADTSAPTTATTGTKKGKKKAASETPEVEEVPFTELMNKQLKKPNPQSSVPPPTIVDVVTPSVTPSDNDQANEEPIIALHVPLRTPSEGPGSAQVVFNVMKMCENKYGWKNIHPNASRFMFNDDDLDDDDDDDMEDDDDEEPKEKEEEKEPVKIDGRKLQKGKPKIGQYDMNDPFIDDTEMLWEEQRASTKDGFFVFWGPLVEEGASARIERADGTIKRNRKKPSTGTTTNTAASSTTSTKKKSTTSRQQTPKATSVVPQQRKLAPLMPLAPIAPQPLLPKQ